MQGKGIYSLPAHLNIKGEKTMDKKFYVMPETEVVELETIGMLAGSPGGLSDDNVLNGKDEDGEGGENFDPNNF